MGKRTQIVATVIPQTGYYKADDKLKAWLHLAPKLNEHNELPDGTGFGLYKEMLNWAQTMDVIQRQINNYTGGRRQILVKQYPLLPGDAAGATGTQSAFKTASGTLLRPINVGALTVNAAQIQSCWNFLGFTEKLYVDGFRVSNELEIRMQEMSGGIQILSHLRKAILTTMQAIDKPGWITEEEQIKYKPDKAMLLDQLGELYRMNDINKILMAPLFKEDNFICRRFTAQLMAVATNEILYFNAALAALKKRNKPEEGEKNNQSNLDEFHKRFSIISEYPDLLKCLGFIQELQLDLTAQQAAGILKSVKTPDGYAVSTLELDFQIFKTSPYFRNTNYVTGDVESIILNQVEFLCPGLCAEVTKCDIAGSQNGNYFFNYAYNPIDKDLAANDPKKRYLQIDGGCVSRGQFMAYTMDSTTYFDNLSTLLQQYIKKIPSAKVNAVQDSTLLGYITQLEHDLVNDTATLQQFEQTAAAYLSRVQQMSELSPDDRANFAGYVNDLLQAIKRKKEALTKVTPEDLAIQVTKGISVQLQNNVNLVDKTRGDFPGNPEYLSLIPVAEADTDMPVLAQFDAGMLMFGHNVSIGYRADVKVTNCANKECDYYSLHRTNMQFLLENQNRDENGNPRAPVAISCNTTDSEPWVAEDFQHALSGDFYLSSELFRWRGWSLVCKDKGDHKDDQGSFSDPNTGHSICKITKDPVPGSLPPLRYGFSYQFRLRIADICGGGLKYHEDSCPDAWSDALPYTRKEKIDKPSIYLGDRKIDDTIKNLINSSIRGEKSNTWVIRSYALGNDIKPAENFVSRYIAPPVMNVDFVMQHGVLDKFDSLTDSDVDELISVADRKMPSTTDDTKAPERVLTVPPNGIIDYLCDPLVDQCNFNGVLLPMKNANNNDAYWKNFNYLKLVLKPGGAVAANGEVSVRRGEVKFVNLSFTANHNLNNCKFNIDSKLLEIQLLHAVQKPCLIDTAYRGGQRFLPSIDDAKAQPIAQRMLESTRFSQDILFPKFPVRTTGNVILNITFDEVELGDFCDGKGFKIVHPTKVVYNGFTPFSKASGQKLDFLNQGDNTEMLKALSSASEQDVIFKIADFDLGDCKFRRISKIEAVIESRFKDYFEAEPVKNSGDAAPFSITGSAVFTDDSQTKVLNTKSPEVPAIDRIVPLITWKQRNKRICDTVRIYFNGDWYGSGEGEQLAVFYSNSEQTDGGPNPKKIGTSSNPFWLTNAISHFARDPIVGNIRFPNKSDALKFAAAGNGKAKLNELNFKRVIFGSNAVPIAPADGWDKNQVDFALFNVLFDSDSRQFYVDIKFDIDTMNIYMPFIKLAIARYQPNSIILPDGSKPVWFSPVVMTDYFQMLPQREITISNKSISKIDGPKRYNMDDASPRFRIVKFHPVNEPVDSEIKTQVNYLQNGVTPGLINFNTLKTTQLDKNDIVEEYEVFDQSGNVNQDKRLIFSYRYPPQ